MNQPSSAFDNLLINLPVVRDARGNLTFIEEERHIPFSLKRVYYLYDVPGGAERAGHGHKALNQLIIAISGSFDVHLDNGFEKRSFHLNRSNQGLLIKPNMWRVVNNFSTGSTCLVLADSYYDESDYYRNYDDFLKAVHNQ